MGDCHDTLPYLVGRSIVKDKQRHNTRLHQNLRQKMGFLQVDGQYNSIQINRLVFAVNNRGPFLEGPETVFHPESP